MPHERDYAAETTDAQQRKPDMDRADRELRVGGRMGAGASWEPRQTAPNDELDSALASEASTTLLQWAVADDCEQHSALVHAAVRKRRAIFTDDDDAEDEASAQVFSVDTTAVAVETTMQLEGEGIVPRVSRGIADRRGAPLRARRVLNLMDRLDGETSNIKNPAMPTLDEGEEDKQQEDTAAIRRTWKRRLTESTTEAEALFLSPPPPRDRRPGFTRSHSSHSVFLAPPKVTFARSTASTLDDGVAVVARVHELVLPTVRSKSHPDLNVIAPQTVADLLSGKYGDRLDGFSLIDCRFGYEFDGGSLKGALSMNDPALVEEHFLRKPPKNSTRMALVFYCEFSANRAPKMLRHIRNLDRWIHAERYPELFYPELYLIDGGYKNCFETLKEVICRHPAQYQTMSDKAFVDQCKRAFATHRANWKHHKSNGCASKFQQLHRHIHDVFGDDSNCDLTHHGEDELLAHPVNLRSLSQQL